jgi:diguanylate cyclase (GGDEF)-like protein/PAS domain S-box-containing protein
LQTHSALFNHTDNPMLRVDARGIVQQGNSAFCRLTHQLPEFISHQTLAELCGVYWRQLSEFLMVEDDTPSDLPFKLAGISHIAYIVAAPDMPEEFWICFHPADIVQPTRIPTAEKALNSLFDTSFDSIAFFDTTGYCQQSNRAFHELLGYSQEETIALNASQLVTLDTELLTPLMSQQLMERGTTDVFERDVLHKNQSIIPVNIRITQVVDHQQQRLGTWIILRDISSNQAQMRTLKHQQQLLELTGRLAGIGGWEYVEKARHVSFTPEACKLLGVSPSDSHKLSDMLKLFAEDSSYEIQASVEVAFLLKTPFDIEVDYLGFKQPRTLRLSGRMKKDGDTQYLVGAIQDISRFKTQPDALPELPHAHRGTSGTAYQDKLTGLPNKIFLMSQVKPLMSQSPEHPLVFIEIDLRNFRRINENAGYSAGDECLLQTARRLQAHVHAQDLVARIGGDEFGVVVVNQPLAATEQLAQSLIDAIEQPIMIENKRFQVQAAACIVVTHSDSDSADILRAANEGIALIQSRETRVHVVTLTSGSDIP